MMIQKVFHVVFSPENKIFDFVVNYFIFISQKLVKDIFNTILNMSNF
jgi:hypothetical protein